MGSQLMGSRLMGSRLVGSRLMGSRLVGSFGKWDKFVLGLFCLSRVSQAKCVLVNGIIWFMESVCLVSKVIPLCGDNCITKYLFLVNCASTP